MKIILTTHIKKLGKLGDQVIVKDGFARNFLFPKNMALRDTRKNLEHFKKIKDEINIKETNKKQKAVDLMEAIKNISIKFTKEADDKDQLYGAVSKKEIISFLNEKNIKLISDDIKITQTIRNLGEHEIEVSPYEGLTEKVKIFISKT